MATERPNTNRNELLLDPSPNIKVKKPSWVVWRSLLFRRGGAFTVLRVLGTLIQQPFPVCCSDIGFLVFSVCMCEMGNSKHCMQWYLLTEGSIGCEPVHKQWTSWKKMTYLPLFIYLGRKYMLWWSAQFCELLYVVTMQTIYYQIACSIRVTMQQNVSYRVKVVTVTVKFNDETMLRFCKPQIQFMLHCMDKRDFFSFGACCHVNACPVLLHGQINKNGMQ